jgi:tetratricopeptide (TPR) repeat protein
VPGLAFTRDGLARFLDGPRFQYEIGELYEELGDGEQARKHLQQAVAGEVETPWQQAAFTLMAAKHLGHEAEAWRRRVEAALSRADVALQTTGSPGLAHYTRGVLLRELGRIEEAREAFRSAVLTRDRSLSQYLGRAGLRSLEDPAAAGVVR